LGADPAEVYAALLTPLAAGGGVDAAALRAHCRWLVDSGLDGVLVAGTTGEGPLLGDDEVIAAVSAVAGEARVIAHVGRPSTAATVALAERALDAGADEVSVVVPYYYELGDDQLLAHFAAVAPVLAYVIPARTVNDVSASLLDRLAAVGVVGVKDSTKSLERHEEYLDVARRHSGFRVYMGSDGLAAEALRRGATGLISAVANVRPDLVVGLRDGKRELQQELSAVRAEAGGLGGLKRTVAERIDGYPVAVRAPLG
jgi:dihydrodipicolinate synthase/N-acetylneuraminate lyase